MNRTFLFVLKCQMILWKCKKPSGGVQISNDWNILFLCLGIEKENAVMVLCLLQTEKQEFGLKPMNCPGHCLMFQHRVRSYRGKFISF